MQRRDALLVLLALGAILPGCAGTGLRDDGSPIFGPRAWNNPPAPAQRQILLTSNRPDATTDPAARQGLAKYFPSLYRNPAPVEATQVAAATKSHYRPTWFGLRPKETMATQTYMTDNRQQLNRPGASPTSLPVALQVPTDRGSSDRMVTPTNAETQVADAPATSSDKATAAAPSTSDIPDFGGKPSKPGEDEVNPLPPAAESSASPDSVADRMPQVPPVDPLKGISTDRPTPKTVVFDDAAPDMDAVKVSTTEADTLAKSEPAKPAQPTNQVMETSKTAPPAKPVLASPQSTPTKHVHVKPTVEVKPSPQGETAKTWKRPCLRRLVRKVCHLGEYADPPTAAPH